MVRVIIRIDKFRLLIGGMNCWIGFVIGLMIENRKL